MKQSVICILALLLALAVLSPNTQAFTLIGCGDNGARWSGNSVTMYVHDQSFPSGSAMRGALQNVVDRWNQAPMDFRIDLSFNWPLTMHYDLVSEIWIADVGPPAFVLPWINPFTCDLIEADMVFDRSVAWTTSTNSGNSRAYGRSARPFQTTAMHEFGHVLGLGHTADRYSIMGVDWTHVHRNGNRVMFYPGEDAVSGAVSIYGESSRTREDLSVAHWRRTGTTNNGYSAHQRTRLLDPFGRQLSSVNSVTSALNRGGGAVATHREPIFRVNPAQIVQLELAFENSGSTDCVTTDVGFFLSTNSFISTGDRRLATRRLTICRNARVSTIRTALVMPKTLPLGDAWLGAIIDVNNSIREIDENNNRVTVQIRN